MILEIAYEDNSLVTEIKENYPDLTIIEHNEGTLKGKKEAFAFKGHWSSRVSPFAILYDDDKKVIHAFYSEVKECTFDEINSYLISYE